MGKLQVNGTIQATGSLVTGSKFSLTKTAATKSTATDQDLVINYNLPSGTSLTDSNAPGIGFHVGNTCWGQITYNNGFKFYDGGSFSSLTNVYANNFIGNLSGNASTATALTTNAGSSSQAIYFSAGKPVALDWHVGNSSVGERNCNNVTYNYCGYYTSNGPSTALGASTDDGSLYSQAYSSSWVSQIAQDYRNGNLFIRGKNNGSWQSWKAVLTSDNYTSYCAPAIHTHSFIEPKGIYTFTSSTLPNSFDFGISCGFVSHDAGFGDYGSVLTVRTYEGGGGTLQLYAPYSPTYGGTHLKARFGNYDSSGGNSWTSLKEIAWTSDLNSYLPLSGGTMSGAITMNVGTGIQMKFEGGKDTRWIYPEGADTFGIRYYEGNPDRMTISASGNNNTTAGADLCINGNGDGTVTIRGNTILHAGNYSSYALPKSGGTVNGNLNVGYSLGISQENGGGNGISLYGGPGYVQSYGLYFAKTSNFGTHGAVTGDWATYFSMDGAVDRGWIFRHANGNKVASISASGIISGAAFSNGSSYHLHPGGGVYVCSTPSITGYLKITLPVGWTNTMFRFDINIYDYSDQNTVTYTVGGYNYQPSAAWYNYSAESRGYGDKANLPVSFGYDGSRCAVYIGWGHTAWSYPQVSISNVLTGYTNYSATWSGSWGIGFSSTNNGTAQVIYNPNSSARTVNYGGSLPSHGYHPGAIFYKT